MRISANIRVTGDELDPDEITSILGVAPYISRRRGDVGTSASGKQTVSKFGYWVWKTEDALGVLTVNEHISQLQSRFAHTEATLRALPNAEHTWIDVCIATEDADERDARVEFLLDVRSIAALHTLGLPIEFNVY